MKFDHPIRSSSQPAQASVVAKPPGAAFSRPLRDVYIALNMLVNRVCALLG